MLAPARSTELKHFSRVLTTNFASISTTATALDLAALITQGTDWTNRIGRSVFIQGVYVEGTLHGGQSNLVTDDNHNTVRLVVASGLPTTMAASFVSAFTLSQYPVNAEILVGCQHVHLDKSIELPSPGPDSTGYMPSIKHFRAYVPINKYVTYGNIAPSDVTTCLVAVSDSSAVSHPGFVTGAFDILFTDA